MRIRIVQSIGEVLVRQRLQREQTAAEAADATGLPEAMLRGLETGSQSLEDVQARAYLRIYSRYLGLDAETLLLRLDAGADPGQAILAAPAERPGPADAAHTAGHQRLRPRAVRRVLLAVTLMVVTAAAVIVGLVLWDGGAWQRLQLIAPLDVGDRLELSAPSVTVARLGRAVGPLGRFGRPALP